jgi:1-deoxy-D-xylulose-5-phosphate reductoisomerase
MKIAILGSTGSIGESTLDVVRQSGGTLKVCALSAHSNEKRLREQADEFNVKKTVVTSREKSEAALLDLVASEDVDAVVIAIVGFAAVKPTLWALRAGKRVALANKEALVTCGELLTAAARKSGGVIIPVDSEHNALFQALQGHPIANVRRLWLTGSGGPFRGKSPKDLLHVNVEQALNHPRWKMGPKITIDSATLMNKGLEYIEARWVFDLNPESIQVVIHPQSIVHGIVEFIDGTMLAHMSVTDMKAAISYALYYPRRQENAVKPLNLVEIGRLDFEAVDDVAFPCVGLARQALNTGGVAPAVLNAANEVAVNAFLNERISFRQIPELISKTMLEIPRHTTASATPESQWDQIFAIDAWARIAAAENIAKL